MEAPLKATPHKNDTRRTAGYAAKHPAGPHGLRR